LPTLNQSSSISCPSFPPHFRNPDVFFLAVNPFTRKIDKLLTNGRTSGRKKTGQYLGHGPLLACFPSAAIGFFLRQSSPVDYQQLWFCFPVQKMATPPRLRSSSSCTPKTTIATAGGREFQTDEPVVCRAKRAAAACMKESERKRGRGKADYLRKPFELVIVPGESSLALHGA
jgi:hypothetical protein